jgi:hypothetical protein
VAHSLTRSADRRSPRPPRRAGRVPDRTRPRRATTSRRARGRGGRRQTRVGGAQTSGAAHRRRSRRHPSRARRRTRGARDPAGMPRTGSPRGARFAGRPADLGMAWPWRSSATATTMTSPATTAPGRLDPVERDGVSISDARCWVQQLQRRRARVDARAYALSMQVTPCRCDVPTPRVAVTADRCLRFCVVG